MRSILNAAERIADTDVCVLIVGEQGTGKELLARHIHAGSRRAGRPFVRLDCQDVADLRGAAGLTGAVTPERAPVGLRSGLLDRISGGTVYLDHISVLAAELQERFLSSLLEDTVADADIRVLAARDPADAGPICLASAGLALVEIPLPALRQRRSDIPLLVEHFLQLYCTRHAVAGCRINTEAMVDLWQYDWPGNVRELESVIERLVVLNRSGVVCASDLPTHIRAGLGRPHMAALPREFATAPPR